MQFIPWRIVINSPPFSTESTVFSDRLLPVVKWAGNTESISRFPTVKIARCFDPVSITVYLEEFYLSRRVNSLGCNNNRVQADEITNDAFCIIYNDV